MGWNEMRWSGVGLGEMGCDAMRWDDMRWDEVRRDGGRLMDMAQDSSHWRVYVLSWLNLRVLLPQYQFVCYVFRTDTHFCSCCIGFWDQFIFTKWLLVFGEAALLHNPLILSAPYGMFFCRTWRTPVFLSSIVSPSHIIHFLFIAISLARL